MNKKTILTLIIIAVLALSGCSPEAVVYTSETARAIQEAGNLIGMGCLLGGMFAGMLA